MMALLCWISKEMGEGELTNAIGIRKSLIPNYRLRRIRQQRLDNRGLACFAAL